MYRLRALEQQYPIKIEQYLGTKVPFIVIDMHLFLCISRDKLTGVYHNHRQLIKCQKHHQLELKNQYQISMLMKNSNVKSQRCV